MRANFPLQFLKFVGSFSMFLVFVCSGLVCVVLVFLWVCVAGVCLLVQQKGWMWYDKFGATKKYPEKV